MIHRMIILAAALAPLSAAAQAQGAVEEVRGGVAAQGCCGQGVEKEQGIAFNGEIVFRSPRFLKVLASPRPVVGATVATDSDATSQIYAGLDWRLDLPGKLFITAGAGGAIHNGETDTYDPVVDGPRVGHTVFLGCRALFRFSGDVGYQLTNRVGASVYYAHISNAGLCENNEGLDHLGARISLKF